MIWTDGYTDYNGTNITERYLKQITKLTTIRPSLENSNITSVKKGKGRISTGFASLAMILMYSIWTLIKFSSHCHCQKMHFLDRK